MAEIVSQPGMATPQKRAYDEYHAGVASSAEDRHTSSSATPSHGSGHRHTSPMSSALSSLTEMSPSKALSPTQKSPLLEPPAKKPKLSFLDKQAEKAAAQREREEKKRAREEEKARKEEEKRIVAEEKEAAKREKEIERAEEQRLKEVKRAEKEAEKARKDLEKAAEQARKDDVKAKKEAEKAEQDAAKLKKERSQMRLNGFFGKTSMSARPSVPDDDLTATKSRRSSVESVDSHVLPSIARTPSRRVGTTFEKWILPYCAAENTELAPVSRFARRHQHDFDISERQSTEQERLAARFTLKDRRRKRSTVRSLVQQIESGSVSTTDTAQHATRELEKVTVKFLSFHEDVRPPYVGTYTQSVSSSVRSKISRCPFYQGLPEKDYDYDSEAEWEPPAEDDEDLDEDDGNSDADDNVSEMDDFLDDTDDAGRKKGVLINMEPISSGICWAERYQTDEHDLEKYAVDVLHDSTTFPIDPYSTKHWDDKDERPILARTESNTSIMQPPVRTPLGQVSGNFVPVVKAEISLDGKIMLTQQSSTTGSTSARKDVRLIQPEYMAAFKKAIDGSDLNKVALIEILKKQFPKCSKNAIKDTLEVMATRIGKKEADKRWRLND